MEKDAKDRVVVDAPRLPNHMTAQQDLRIGFVDGLSARNSGVARTKAKVVKLLAVVVPENTVRCRVRNDLRFAEQLH